MKPPFVTALEPVPPQENAVTPVVAYASVRIGPVTVHRVAVLRHRDGSITTGMPRNYDGRNHGWQQIVTMDDDTGRAVRDACAAAYREHAA